MCCATPALCFYLGLKPHALPLVLSCRVAVKRMMHLQADAHFCQRFLLQALHCWQEGVQAIQAAREEKQHWLCALQQLLAKGKLRRTWEAWTQAHNRAVMDRFRVSVLCCKHQAVV